MSTMRLDKELRYQQRKLTAISEEMEQWKADHEEANDCHLVESVVGDLIAVADEVREVDTRLHLSYCDGLEFDPRHADLLAQALGRWKLIAARVLDAAERFVAKGYEVPQLAELRLRNREIVAMLRPSDVANDEAEAEALAEHRRGETEPFPATAD